MVISDGLGILAYLHFKQDNLAINLDEYEAQKISPFSEFLYAFPSLKYTFNCNDHPYELLSLNFIFIISSYLKSSFIYFSHILGGCTEPHNKSTSIKLS